jgi:transglutaminase/protease-like cytokinesis protein 3
VRELSKHSGIRCEIINGYGRRMGSNIGGTGFLNHSWNAVLLNDKWYVCDPAWSAGFVDGPTGTFKFQFEDAYFLADPEVFVRSHYPVDTTWAFVGEISSLEEFLNGPVIYAKALTYDLRPVSPANYKITVAKDEKIFFGLEGRCEKYQGDHIFKRRGVFLFHIFLDTYIIATYEVTVR